MSQRWDDLKKRAGELQVKLQAAMATKVFNPDQPRDDHGRWSDSAGGSGEIGSKEKARMRRIDRVMNPDGSVNLDSTTRESGSGNYATTPWDAEHITAYGGTESTRSGLMAAHSEFRRSAAEWDAKERDRIMNPNSKYKNVSTDGTWKDYVHQNHPNADRLEAATLAHENTGGRVGTTRIKTESSHGSEKGVSYSNASPAEQKRREDILRGKSAPDSSSLQKMIMALDPSNIREIGKRREDILESRLADAEEMLSKAFNPDQDRDDHGRWSGGGSGDSGDARVKSEARGQRDQYRSDNHVKGAVQKEVDRVLAAHLDAVNSGADFDPNDAWQSARKELLFQGFSETDAQSGANAVADALDSANEQIANNTPPTHGPDSFGGGSYNQKTRGSQMYRANRRRGQ